MLTMPSPQERRSPLPDFLRPPVVEVAVGVQFDAQPVLRSVEVAALREKWRSAYPVVEEHPPLPPAIEAEPGSFPDFQVFMGPPAGRLWFVSRDGTSLVQLQPDRLYINWRSTEAASAYPRWGHVRDTFAERMRDVFEFVHLAEGRVPAIGQVEVTYINAIDDEDGKPAALQGVLKAWSANDDHHLGGAQEARAALVYRVPDMGRAPVRLYVEAAPGKRLTGEPTSFLTLTVRGAPVEDDLAASIEFADKGHDHIVSSFAELTPPAMHTLWGRRQ